MEIIEQYPKDFQEFLSQFKTDQGNISTKHLQYYLNEFAFRFNRKLSTYRGKLFFRLMQQAVETQPITLNEIIK